MMTTNLIVGLPLTRPRRSALLSGTSRVDPACYRVDPPVRGRQDIRIATSGNCGGAPVDPSLPNDDRPWKSLPQRPRLALLAGIVDEACSMTRQGRAAGCHCPARAKCSRARRIAGLFGF